MTASHTVPPPARRLSPPPASLEVVGGRGVTLDGMVALDRVASGHGALTITWTLIGAGHDLLALSQSSRVDAHSGSIVIDLVPGMRCVLICTGTAREVTLPESRLTVTNGATSVECRLPAGISYGVWPRLSLVRVDEFIVIIDERDASSGDLAPVAQAYGYETDTFVRAGG